MTIPAIQVEGLCKRYAVGVEQQHGTFYELLTHSLKAPFRRLRNLGRLPQTNEEFWALRDVDFEVQPGEVLGVIGRNGAGKSTLLKILSRISAPTRGAVRIRGRLASLLEIGTGFHPELSGRENIFLNGALLGLSRADVKRRFDEIVAFSDISKFLDTPVKRYSSGMYVRLAFAVAAHVEADTLLVDEVLAVGDAEFQKRCLGKMGDVAKSGRTVIFVSHNLLAVRHLCTRGLLMERGRIQMSGSAEECVAAYERSSRESRGSIWTRQGGSDDSALAITKIESALLGRQPSHVLRLDISLQSTKDHKPAFIAVDVLDETGTAILQALPRLDGFLEYARQPHKTRVLIDLPSLIPGQYLATVWVGSSNTETYDQISEAVKFEVTDSPTPGRTYPHTKDHGFIVPASRVIEG